MSPRIHPRSLNSLSAMAGRHGARANRASLRKTADRSPAYPAGRPPAGLGSYIGPSLRDADTIRLMPVDSPERRRLPMLLRRAWYGLNQAFRHITAQAGITPDQFTVLRTLHELGLVQLTQIDLAERMSSDPNTIASLVQRMEQQGLIERRTNAADRRAHSLILKPAGHRKFRRVRRQAVALQKTILAALPEATREGFLARLEIIANACRQAAQMGRAVRLARRPERLNAQGAAAISRTGTRNDGLLGHSRSELVTSTHRFAFISKRGKDP